MTTNSEDVDVQVRHTAIPIQTTADIVECQGSYNHVGSGDSGVLLER